MVVCVAPSEHKLDLSWRPNFEPNEISVLTTLFPRGDLNGGFYGSSGFGWTKTPIRGRMLVVITENLGGEVRLRVPNRVSVVYVQRGKDWAMYPPAAPTLRQTLRLEPGAHPEEATVVFPARDRWERDWLRTFACRTVSAKTPPRLDLTHHRPYR